MMKRLIALALCAAMLFSVTAFADEHTNISVLCFSATDNTWGIAEKIAAATGADLMRIEAEIPYTADDLNWHDDNSRANREQNDDTCRPGIANLPENLDSYDTVFVGFPIWWGTIPQIIKTLVEAVDFQGKTIVPFCTSGSSAISSAVQDLKALDSGAEVLDSGRRFPADASEQDVRDWLNEIGYAQEAATMNRIIITVGEHDLTVRLAENESTKALLDWLSEGPKTISASNYGGFEKVCPLGVRLPSQDVQTSTQPGDVMLYSGDQIVLFHGNNAWAYTRLGWIEGKTQEELRDILSGQESEITLDGQFR